MEAPGADGQLVNARRGSSPQAQSTGGETAGQHRWVQQLSEDTNKVEMVKAMGHGAGKGWAKYGRTETRLADEAGGVRGVSVPLSGPGAGTGPIPRPRRVEPRGALLLQGSSDPLRGGEVSWALWALWETLRTQGLPAAPRSGKWPVRQGQGRARAARRGHSGDSAHPVGVGAHRHFVGVSGHGVWPQCVDPHGWQPHVDQSTGLRGRPRPRLALPPRPLVLRPATSTSISSSGKTGQGSLSNSRVLSEATWPPGG